MNEESFWFDLSVNCGLLIFDIYSTFFGGGSTIRGTFFSDTFKTKSGI
jgi:hypothetical protein